MTFKTIIIVVLAFLFLLELATSLPLDETLNSNKNSNTSAKLTKVLKKENKNRKQPKHDPGDFITVPTVNKNINPKKAVTKDTFLRDVETLAPKEARRGVRILVKPGGMKNQAEILGKSLRKQIKNIGLGNDRRKSKADVSDAAAVRRVYLNRGVKQVGLKVKRRRTTLIIPRPLPDDSFYTDTPFFGFPPDYLLPGAEFTPFPNHLNPFDPRLPTPGISNYPEPEQNYNEYEDP